VTSGEWGSAGRPSSERVRRRTVVVVVELVLAGCSPRVGLIYGGEGGVGVGGFSIIVFFCGRTLSARRAPSGDQQVDPLSEQGPPTNFRWGSCMAGRAPQVSGGFFFFVLFFSIVVFFCGRTATKRGRRRGRRRGHRQQSQRAVVGSSRPQAGAATAQQCGHASGAHIRPNEIATAAASAAAATGNGDWARFP